MIVLQATTSSQFLSPKASPKYLFSLIHPNIVTFQNPSYFQIRFLVHQHEVSTRIKFLPQLSTIYHIEYCGSTGNKHAWPIRLVRLKDAFWQGCVGSDSMMLNTRLSNAYMQGLKWSTLQCLRFGCLYVSSMTLIRAVERFGYISMGWPACSKHSLYSAGLLLSQRNIRNQTYPKKNTINKQSLWSTSIQDVFR